MSGFVRAAGLVVLGYVLIVTPGPTQAQSIEEVKARFTKVERLVPMRDGVRLFTAIYVPKDQTKPAPILLQRTPYSVAPYGVDEYESTVGPSSLFTKAGYIVAYQDVRGCYMSEGKFEDVRPRRLDKSDPKAIDEATDTYDTIDWLVKNIPNNNGRVGMWGISYPGFYAAAGLIEAHPALKAVSPQAPLVDWFLGDDTHHNGAFFLQQEFNFDAVFGAERPEPTTQRGTRFDHGTPDAYTFFLRMGPLARADELYFKGKRKFWNDVMRHGNYDEFWKTRSLLPALKEVKPAVMTVGGWFDAENLYGALHTYKQVENTSPGATNTLVMGPWTHGGWAGGTGASLGPIRFGAKTAEFYREKVELPFFERHLKEQRLPELPEAWAFETGRNRWRSYDRWPPKETKPAKLFLGAAGTLGFDPPAPSASRFDEFVSDPNRPVPYTNTISIDCPNTYPVEDQRFAARRPDVLVYQTEPLAQDLTIAGPIPVELFVSTTGTDADWVVKLIDVHPERTADRDAMPLRGYQQLVRGDVMRGKFRESFETPKPFTPGEPTLVPFTLQDCHHTFLAGHRVMVQVQSSWFPLVDRNPQTFTDIYSAKPEAFRKADHRVYHEPSRSSALVLPRLP